ncbi:hypothetical protein KGP17_15150 [Serratia sp. JSRIV001]|uniref:hypothetical protein n=1 Tax=Serratia sp. JSRIV001 TaxID=2831893 RepID=UPI001CC09CB0|nr:hypothetical protein [Serratia sp. JSRIV001]UAN43828.1 hypothetical protein KGP17_15150 [Serratia sp. JSRIV001]
MNPISSTIIEGVRIYYPTVAEPMPAPDPELASLFGLQVIGIGYTLTVTGIGNWLAGSRCLPHPPSSLRLFAITRAGISPGSVTTPLVLDRSRRFTWCRIFTTCRPIYFRQLWFQDNFILRFWLVTCGHLDTQINPAATWDIH